MYLNLYAILLVFAPLIASVVVGLNTSRIGDKISQVITCCGVFISAICAYIIFYHVEFIGQIIHVKLFRWIESGDFIAEWAIKIDVLTAIMLVLITTVSSVVHLYSVGYMEHDDHKPRFMSYISLFTFFMISLVCSDNLIQLFFGWEGVGLCSYLLVGFWFKKNSANQAALKAFIMNRVGDIGFALGIFLTFMTFGSVEFSSIFPQVPEFANQSLSYFGFEVNIITLICVLLFIGCMGKSAQLGLHPWLADAMEGPTPVSALIHAATMVTAGVFLVVRCSPIFEYTEVARNFVTVVGALTCFIAATIALVQTDIKKIIAYSTCSQLGYMFLAAGVSAYSAAIFHLLTHGFFKALLFLSAGSVIHAIKEEQNIFKMGGLWKYIPYTCVMMWIGALALGAIYPFAGFYSKDMVLEAAYGSDTFYGIFGYVLGALAAMCTTFYSWRLIIIAFNGEPRAPKKVMDRVHESPLVMTIPLFILSIGAIFGGYIGEDYLGMVSPSGEFWRNSIVSNHEILQNAANVSGIEKHLPLIFGVIGILIAYLLYTIIPSLSEKLYHRMRFIHQLLLNKWYFDEIYNFLFVKSFKFMSTKLWKTVDIRLIDNIPMGTAMISNKLAKSVSLIQTGYIYHYALIMFLGLVILLTWSIIGI